MTISPLQRAHAVPTVSVILSVYNGANFLSEAVDSVLRQTLPDFEFVIVDDASTDDTASFLASIADRRVRIIRNPVNLGLTCSLNLALREARGRYVARLDHDDVALPNRLEKQKVFLDDNPDVCLVGSWAEYIDAFGKSKGVWKTPTSPESVARDMLRGNCFIHPSAMFRRDAVENVGGYNETLRYSQDYDLWLRMLDHGLGANIPECLVRYRIHPGQITSKKLIGQLRCAKQAVKDTYSRRGLINSHDHWDRLDAPIANARCHSGSAAFYLMQVAILQEHMGYTRAALRMLIKSQVMAPLSTKPGRRILTSFQRSLKWR
jgi:glycosyltransferase involved in cell wall biosynthesis